MTETVIQNPLFQPLNIGELAMPNRIVMAPMTRGRATPEGVPTALQSQHYVQRASAGLIVTEGTGISRQGLGWPCAPGVWNEAQQAGWESVVSAVHEAGGRIYCQLWHMGRTVLPVYLDGALPVAPSAIAVEGKGRLPEGGFAPYVTPRALEIDELPGIVEDYAKAAARAIAAGFDGVEIHGANGYLVDSFIRSGANQRDDEYGGRVDRRWRFPLEVVDAVAETVGANRTGIRFSPTGSFNSMSDEDPVASYGYGASQLDRFGLAYIHVIDPRPGHFMATEDAPPAAAEMRKNTKTPMILNGGFDEGTGARAVMLGRADAISFGVPFIANPDLPERYAEGWELTPPDRDTFYPHGAEGYVDYPPHQS